MSIDFILACTGSIFGIFSLFPTRSQLVSGDVGVDSLSVIIPARDEERNIRSAITSIRDALGSDVEVIVADDQSSDRTAQEAAACGAAVVHVGVLPTGWTGKSHACWQGQQVATGRYLAFVDADVRLGPSARILFSRLVATVAESSETLVSVQPWHITVRFTERFSLLFNVVSVMASRCRGLWRAQQPLAFGPVIVCDARSYRAKGGHGNSTVRGSVIEDVSLGRLFKRGVVTVAAREDLTFRMYDSGLRGVFDGFVKNFASAASTATLFSMISVAAWFVFLCSPLLVGLAMYPICVLQVFFVSRVVGRFSLLDALIYPLHMLFFVAVLGVSFWRRIVTKSAPWKGRMVGL